MNTLVSNTGSKNAGLFSQKPGGKPVVLVTGVDEDTRQMLKIGLEMCDYDVAEARGCEESINFAKTRRPCLIVMDAILPFGENLKAMDKLRDSDAARDVPVILLSGFSQHRFQKAALDHGVKGFLVKPVDWERLEVCISAVLQTRETRAEVCNANRL